MSQFKVLGVVERLGTAAFAPYIREYSLSRSEASQSSLFHAELTASIPPGSHRIQHSLSAPTLCPHLPCAPCSSCPARAASSPSLCTALAGSPAQSISTQLFAWLTPPFPSSLFSKIPFSALLTPSSPHSWLSVPCFYFIFLRCTTLPIYFYLLWFIFCLLPPRV